MLSATPEDIGSLNGLIHGFKVSRMLGLAADLGIADRIAPNQPESAASLAVACGVLADPLLRLCRALASFGVFTVTADDMIGHSSRSLLLRADSVPSLQHSARFSTGRSDWTAWGEIERAMHGATPFIAVWGAHRFEHLKNDPEQARLFDAVMANSLDDRFGAVALAYDFSTAALIVDVGGGNGALLRAILRRYPQPLGLIFDRADVVEAITADELLSGRIQVATGDFFAQNPPRADMYLLSWILHDWGDPECRRILSNCRRSMQPGARLLLVERVLEADPLRGSSVAYLGDMQMMVVTGGRERTLAEYQTLLSECGFGTARVFTTSASVQIVESRAA